MSIRAITQERRGFLLRWHTDVVDDAIWHRPGESDFEHRKAEIEFKSTVAFWVAARSGRRLVRFEREEAS